MIIERKKEAEKIDKSKKWIFVYGRRKTGKTFLVKNFAKYDEYYFVKRNKSIIDQNNRSVEIKVFEEILRRELKKKIIVIDEFHRLGDDFLDFLHFLNGKGKLILISSTLWLSKKLLKNKSPILGLVTEIPIGLIDPLLIFKKLKIQNKKEIVEKAIIGKEPITLDIINKKIGEIIIDLKTTIPALIGEIFEEEEKELSAIYEAILRAIAIGKKISSEISSLLFSKGLLKKDDPSIIQQYLLNLVNFGLIKKIKIFGKKKRFIYEHISPLFWIYFYADEKYNISERKINENEMEKIIVEIMPRIVESNLREIMAEKYGLIEGIGTINGREIDVCLLKFKRPFIAAEIKWKKNISKGDIKKAEENLDLIDCKEKFIIVPDKKKVKYKTKYKIIEGIEILKN